MLHGLPLAQEDGMSHHEMQTLTNRVRCEFIEMPGLRLTKAQAGRLWGLDTRACQEVIESLVRTGFLQCSPAGTITRA